MIADNMFIRVILFAPWAHQGLPEAPSLPGAQKSFPRNGLVTRVDAKMTPLHNSLACIWGAVQEIHVNTVLA